MNFFLEYRIPFIWILPYLIQEIIVSDLFDTLLLIINDFIFLFICSFYCQFVWNYFKLIILRVGELI
jgi:hypothetical protein